jgi:hypothetical protein
LVVVLLMPLSSSMYNGEFDHGWGSGGSGGGGSGSGGGGSGGGGGGIAAVEYNYWRKRPATRALTVA